MTIPVQDRSAGFVLQAHLLLKLKCSTRIVLESIPLRCLLWADLFLDRRILIMSLFNFRLLSDRLRRKRFPNGSFHDRLGEPHWIFGVLTREFP